MKTIKISLNKAKSIDKAIEYLEKYQEDLQKKIIELKKRLIEEVGVKVAYENSGKYAGYLLFEPQGLNDEVSFMVGTNTEKYVVEWYASKKDAKNKENARSYEISPLLMAEFGSGWLAGSGEMFNIEGVGQGTMPDQKHAFDTRGWFWYDKDGSKHHSIGESPTQPMYQAAVAMMLEVDKIAKEVFNVV